MKVFNKGNNYYSLKEVIGGIYCPKAIIEGIYSLKAIIEGSYSLKEHQTLKKTFYKCCLRECQRLIKAQDVSELVFVPREQSI